MSKIHPVIMCGGAGSRLWPLSRSSQPKQFLPLVEERTMFQATAARIAVGADRLSMADPTVICGLGQADIVSGQLLDIGSSAARIIVEPFPKNTAAVAAVSALSVAEDAPDGLVLLLPADHHVADLTGFWDGVAAGVAAAEAGELVTLGIEPTGPDTGYGYIHRGTPLGGDVYKVQKFREKPDAKTAQAFLDTGEFFWNAGIFLFRADAMIEAFERHAPDILSACRAAFSPAGLVELDPSAFKASPSEPVDIAIMEKAGNVAVVAPVRAGWSDVGSWQAVAELRAGETPDPHTVFAVDCEDCLFTSDGPVIGAIGLKDVIVVAAGGSVLVLPKDRAQDVKKVVEALKARGLKDFL